MFLNLPVDVPIRRRMGRERRKTGMELRAVQRASGPPPPEDTNADRLPFIISNVHFSYPERKTDRVKPEKKAPSAKPSLFTKCIKSAQDGLEDLVDDLESALDHLISMDEATQAIEATQAKEKKKIASKEEAAITIQLQCRARLARNIYRKRLLVNRGGIKGYSWTFEQGKMIAILGNPSQGKVCEPYPPFPHICLVVCCLTMKRGSSFRALSVHRT